MKKITLIILLMILSFSLYSRPLKIVWWNVRNFFDTKNDPLKEDIVLKKGEFDYKMDRIQKTLTKINADIVGLCEIENYEVLQKLAELTKYPYFYLAEGNDSRGIDIALMSRIEATYITHINTPAPYADDKNYLFSRDCPEAIINFNNKKIHILLNHLKSNARDDNTAEKKRIGQISGILDIIGNIYDTEPQEPYILLMGDFNSNRYTEPLNILEKSGIKILNYLYHPRKLFTIKYKNRYEDIDFFMLNQKLYKESKIIKMESFYTEDYIKASDHIPLFLILDL